MVTERPLSQSQPARAIVYDKRWTIPTLAREIGVSPGHLHAALFGRCAPSPQVREQLPVVLGHSLDELFTQELLAKTWRGPGINHHTLRAAGGATNV